MGFYITMDDVVFMAVSNSFHYLSHVMTVKQFVRYVLQEMDNKIYYIIGKT